MRQLPKSKTLIVREGGGSSYVFSIIFIANLQGLEDIFSGPAFGGEVLDVGIDRSDRSDSGSGGCRERGGFSVSKQLGVTISFGFSLCLRRPTFISAVSLFVTSETESFSDAVSLLGRRELFQMNGIHIRSV